MQVAWPYLLGATSAPAAQSVNHHLSNATSTPTASNVAAAPGTSRKRSFDSTSAARAAPSKPNGVGGTVASAPDVEVTAAEAAEAAGTTVPNQPCVVGGTGAAAADAAGAAGLTGAVSSQQGPAAEAGAGAAATVFEGQAAAEAAAADGAASAAQPPAAPAPPGLTGPGSPRKEQEGHQQQQQPLSLSLTQAGDADPGAVLPPLMAPGGTGAAAGAAGLEGALSSEQGPAAEAAAGANDTVLEGQAAAAAADAGPVAVDAGELDVYSDWARAGMAVAGCLERWPDGMLQDDLIAAAAACEPDLPRSMMEQAVELGLSDDTFLVDDQSRIKINPAKLEEARLALAAA